MKIFIRFKRKGFVKMSMIPVSIDLSKHQAEQLFKLLTGEADTVELRFGAGEVREGPHMLFLYPSYARRIEKALNEGGGAVIEVGQNSIITGLEMGGQGFFNDLFQQLKPYAKKVFDSTKPLAKEAWEKIKPTVKAKANEIATRYMSQAREKYGDRPGVSSILDFGDSLVRQHLASQGILEDYMLTYAFVDPADLDKLVEKVKYAAKTRKTGEDGVRAKSRLESFPLILHHDKEANVRLPLTKSQHNKYADDAGDGKEKTKITLSTSQLRAMGGSLLGKAWRDLSRPEPRSVEDENIIALTRTGKKKNGEVYNYKVRVSDYVEVMLPLDSIDLERMPVHLDDYNASGGKYKTFSLTIPKEELDYPADTPFYLTAGQVKKWNEAKKEGKSFSISLSLSQLKKNVANILAAAGSLAASRPSRAPRPARADTQKKPAPRRSRRIKSTSDTEASETDASDVE